MTAAAPSENTWEKIHAGRAAYGRYPWDAVVTFVFRHAPRDRPRSEVQILEVGCGGGNNLWFAAREGFRTAGVDISPSAIDYARRRFAEEGLAGEFHVGDFSPLPLVDGRFDLAVDRGSLTCCGRSAALRAVSEIRRVLRPGGRFFCNPYSDRHVSGASGRPGPDGLTVDIREGALAGFGPICLYDRAAAEGMLGDGWRRLQVHHVEVTDGDPPTPVHAEWRMIGEKIT